MDFRKQAAINSVGSVVLMLGQWLISVLLVRMSGYEDAGIFSLAMTVSNVFGFFANYGLRSYQVSDVQGRFTQGQYLLTRVITSVLSVGACAVYLLVAGGYSPVERWAILLYLLYSNVNVISDTMLGTLQLHDRLYINGYSNILRGAVCFAAFVGTYLAVHNLLISLGVMALGSLVLTVAYDWRCARRVETLAPWNRADGKAVAQILRICFALMLSNIFPVITTALPRRAIQKLAGTEQLGYFSSIFTPTALITTLVPAIIIALVPKLADAWTHHRRRDLLCLVGQMYAFTLAFVLVAELAALVAGRFVMQLIFGEGILQYYSLLYWAILATGINGLTYCGNVVLIAVGSNRAVAVGSGAAMVVTIGLVDTLVRMQGMNGAAYMLAFAYALQVVIQTIVFLTKIFSQRPEAQ